MIQICIVELSLFLKIWKLQHFCGKMVHIFLNTPGVSDSSQFSAKPIFSICSEKPVCTPSTTGIFCYKMQDLHVPQLREALQHQKYPKKYPYYNLLYSTPDLMTFSSLNFFSFFSCTQKKTSPITAVLKKLTAMLKLLLQKN